MSAGDLTGETPQAQPAENEAAPDHETATGATASGDATLGPATTNVADVSTGSQRDTAEESVTERPIAPESGTAQDESIPGAARVEPAVTEETAMPGDRNDKAGVTGAKSQREGPPESQHSKAAADDSKLVAEVDEQTNQGGEARGGAATHPDQDDRGVLSKNQLKKKRKREQIEERKLARRLQEKEKRRTDVERRRAEREAVLASLSPEEQQKFLEERKKLMNEKRDKLAREDRDVKTKMLESKYAVCIDLEWFPDLTEREQNSLMKQLNFAYSTVKKAVGLGRDGLRLSFSGVDSALREVLAKKNTGFEAWPVVWSDKSLTETFDKGTLVYLTHESSHVLREMDPDKVYIIGGIVDRNRIKGGTAQKAQELGISTARLDLDAKKMRFTTGTTVLTVNHVVEILLEAANGEEWQEAMRKVLPNRKGLVGAGQSNAGPTGPGEPAAQTAVPGAEHAAQPDQVAHSQAGEKDSQPASNPVGAGVSSNPSLPNT